MSVNRLCRRGSYNHDHICLHAILNETKNFGNENFISKINFTQIQEKNETAVAIKNKLRRMCGDQLK